MQPASLTPKRYGGRFETENEIGHGGMGAVYRARDLESDELVALKVLYEREGPNAERFVQEAAMLAELSHPAIVRYVHHGITPGGEHFLAMEWLEGRTLEDHMMGGVPLPLQATVEMAARMMDALTVAHRRGMVHRDLKPANIFLPGSRLPAAKLLDFGIARRLFDGRRLTRAGSTLGTPMYMSPEQARGAVDVDSRSDVFSLGCVLFECLTGQPPFRGDTPVAVLAKICLEQEPDLRRLRPEVPPSLAAIVHSMLAKDPAQRPGDTAGLARSFATLADKLRRGDVEKQESASALESVTVTPVEQRLFSVVLVHMTRKGPKSSPTGPFSSSDSASDLTSAHPDRLSSGQLTPVSLPALRHGPQRSPSSIPSTPASSGDAQAITKDQLAATLHDDAVMAKIVKTLQPYNVQVERFYNGSLAITHALGASNIEQAVDMARCAIELKRLLPSAAFAVASARAEADFALPVGPVLESAGALLSGAPPGSVHIDELSASLLATRFELTEPEAEVNQRRRLLYEKGLREPPRTVAGRPVPWVGRERELSSLTSLYSEIIEDSVARAAIITGAAGVGKSRLRHELLERLYSQGIRFELLAGRGESMRASSAWAMLGSALRAAADLSGYEAAEVQQKRFAAHIGRRFSDEAARRRVVAFMGEIASIHFPDADFPLLRSAREDPRAMSDQTRTAWMDWIEAELAAGPVVMMFEDMHWGDVPSFQLADIALRVFHDKPLLVLGFARPELREKYPGLWEARAAEQVELAPLAPKMAKRFVQAVWPEATETQTELLATKSGGNPFFIEELVRVSLEQGAEAMANTPVSVLAVVQGRLDALGEYAKRVLRAASVFGLTCRRSGVAALLGETNLKDVETWLAMLVEREILFCRTSGAAREYVFRQAIVREASYATLVDRDRIAAHGAAGEFLERLGAENPSEVAEHFVCAEQRPRAGHWFRVAGEQALAASDLDGGLGYCERALACGLEEGEVGSTLLLEARLRYWKGDPKGARTAVSRAVPLLEGVAQLEALGEFVNVLGHLAVEQGSDDPEEYANYLNELILHKAQGQNRDLWLAMTFRGGTHGLWMGRSTAETLRLAHLNQHHPRQPVAAAATNYLMNVETQEGRWSEVIKYAERAAATFRSFGNLQEALLNEMNLISALEASGQLSKAALLSEGLFAEAKKHGLSFIADGASCNLAKILLELGDASNASRWAAVTIGRSVAEGNARLEVYARMVLARSALLEGHMDAAANEAKKATARAGTAPSLLAVFKGVEALVHLSQGLVDPALSCAAEALELIRVYSKGDTSLDSLFVGTAAARVYIAAGDGKSAAQALAPFDHESAIPLAAEGEALPYLYLHFREIKQILLQAN